MKRNVGIVAVVLLLVVVAVLVLRPERQATVATGDSAAILDGRFSDDSLGVVLVQVPPQRGWRMRRDAAIPGYPVVSAESRDGSASWSLFITPSDKVKDLNEVILRRRDQLAGMFGVTDLEQVVSKVMNEDVKDRDGYPAVQWQAISKPVDVAGSDAIHVMFMWVATLRERYAYEGVGLLRIPVDQTQRSAVTDSLLQDVAFILESMRFD